MISDWKIVMLERSIAEKGAVVSACCAYCGKSQVELVFSTDKHVFLSCGGDDGSGEADCPTGHHEAGHTASTPGRHEQAYVDADGEADEAELWCGYSNHSEVVH
jgi:hypothetical protein